MRGDAEIVDPHRVARRLVVEGKGVALVADLLLAARDANPRAARRLYLRERPRLAIHGLQRIARQQVLHVREDELLVLLLVLDAQIDERARVRVEASRGDEG